MKRRKRIMLCAALAAALLVTGGCNMRGQEIPDKDGKKTAEPGGIATGDGVGGGSVYGFFPFSYPQQT